ncbi:DUF1573 domain-containing protein [Candidatus Latescibacterota bacterium]
MNELIKQIGPSINFYETDYYFGTIYEGEKLSHTFKYSNIGTDEIIVSTEVTCNCTASMLKGNKIAPDKSGEILIEYDTKGKKGNTRQLVIVRTNDPENPEVKLFVSANVIRNVEVIPEMIWLGEVPRNELIKRELNVVKSIGNELEVINVIVPFEIDAEIKENIQKEMNGSKTVPIELSINTGEFLGRFNKNIIVLTNDIIRPEIVVKISGVVIEDLKALPPSIFYGEVLHDTEVIREITLSPTNGGKPEIARALSSSPYISTEVQKIENGSKYKLIATLHSPGTDMTISDKIPIYINGNKEPAIEIPVYARVVGAQE